MDGTGTDCPLGMRLPRLRLRELDCCSVTVLGKPIASNGTVTNSGNLVNPNIVIGNGGSSVIDSMIPITDVVTAPAPDGPLVANKLVMGDPALGNTVESTTIGVTGGNSLTNVNNIAVITINGSAPGAVSSVTGDATFITASPTTGAVALSLTNPKTKGSIITGNSTNPVQFAVGTDNYLLQLKSAAADGLTWVDPTTLFAGLGTGTNTHVARWNGTGVTAVQDSGVVLSGPTNADYTNVSTINCTNTTQPTVSSTTFVAGCVNTAQYDSAAHGACGEMWTFVNSGTATVTAGISGFVGALIDPGVGATVNITGNETVAGACTLTGNMTIGDQNWNVLFAVDSTSANMNSFGCAILACSGNPNILGQSRDCAIIGCNGFNQIGTNPATAQKAAIILASSGVMAAHDYTVCGGYKAAAAATANRTWELRGTDVGVEGAGTVGATNAGALVLHDTVYPGVAFGDLAEMYENSVSGVIPDGTILTRDPLVRQKCKVAAPGDPILGVVSATATVVSGVAEFEWHKRYKTSRFGRNTFTRDASGKLVPVENPDFKADQPYVPRLARPQDYTICGYSGRVLVRAGDYDWSTALYAQPGPDGKAQPSTDPTMLEVEMLHSAYDPTDGYAVVLCLVRPLIGP